MEEGIVRYKALTTNTYTSLSVPQTKCSVNAVVMFNPKFVFYNLHSNSKDAILMETMDQRMKEAEEGSMNVKEMVEMYLIVPDILFHPL